MPITSVMTSIGHLEPRRPRGRIFIRHPSVARPFCLCQNRAVPVCRCWTVACSHIASGALFNVALLATAARVAEKSRTLPMRGALPPVFSPSVYVLNRGKYSRTGHGLVESQACASMSDSLGHALSAACLFERTYRIAADDKQRLQYRTPQLFAP